jgi:hypothetical protein
MHFVAHECHWLTQFTDTNSIITEIVEKLNITGY